MWKGKLALIRNVTGYKYCCDVKRCWAAHFGLCMQK